MSWGVLLCCLAAIHTAVLASTDSDPDNSSFTTNDAEESLLNTHITLGATTAISLDQALQALCAVVGLGLTIDTHYRPTKKLVVYDGTLRDVLDSLCGADLTWEIRDRHLYVSTARYCQNHRAPFSPTHTKIWTEISNTLLQILGNDSQFTINSETGILLATGSKSQHGQITNYLGSLERQQTTQTCISVTVIKVESSRSMDTGASWSGVCDALESHATSASPGSIEVVATKSVLQTICKALEAHGKVRATSNAIVSAANNRKAVLQIDTNLVYFVPETITTPGSAKRGKVELHTHTMSTTNTGTLLRIQPTVTQSGVILDLHFRVSSQVGDTQNPAHRGYGKVPLINKQLIDTTVNLRRGHGILLGGLLARCTKRHRSGFPVLSRLPVLGALFGTTTHLKKYERVYIYIQLLPSGGNATNSRKKIFRSTKTHKTYTRKPNRCKIQ